MSTDDLALPPGAKPYSTPQELLRWRLFVSLGLLLPIAGLAFAVIRLWRIGPVWPELIAFAGMYLISGFGITVGYHRLLSHRSFSVPRWIYLAFAVMGSVSAIGPAAIWVATHRRHHVFSDRGGDPHSPHDSRPGRLRSIAHGYIGWLYTPDYSPLERWAPEILRDPTMMWINRHFFTLVGLGIVVPALIVLAVTQSFSAFLGTLLWAGPVRVCICTHAVFFVNTFCHVFGTRPFDTKDQSHNLWPIAIPSLGECWHNNHHAYPSAAISGIGRWQIDPSGMLIRMLEVCRLAWDVKRAGR
jgi:stearoyl-CoA desaturase (delta-9 desaturase)